MHMNNYVYINIQFSHPILSLNCVALIGLPVDEGKKCPIILVSKIEGSFLARGEKLGCLQMGVAENWAPKNS